jgi:hypothetical protein
MKKYTIEQIFDWLADQEEFLHFAYKQSVVKNKKIPKNVLPFERFCLLDFENGMKEYDELVKRTKKRL